MPHLTLEYSANLGGLVDIDALCDALASAILESGLFEIGAIRVRALRAEAYAIADRHVDNAFIDMSFRIGAGRTDEEKQQAGALIFARANATRCCSPRESRLTDPLTWGTPSSESRLVARVR